MTTAMLVTGIFLVMMTPAFAQPGDPGGEPDVPISGVEILIVSGSLLGVRRLLALKKTKIKK